MHVAYPDAEAYAKWAGKRLPTEAEFEYAARGGLAGKTYAWGDEFRPNGKWMANTWQGKFPVKDAGEDGYRRLAPVAKFPANGYGLYDMAGNVWQWCSDWYRPDYYAQLAKEKETARNPRGPDSPLDPDEPNEKKRVHRGGSFLCNPINIVRNATPPPRFEVKAPAKAPNVLIVLIDDMGFGQSSAFGGPIHMPTVERLANGGLRYNEFHTTALCSPTRAALLSGPQPSHEQHGLDHGDRHRLPRPDRAAPQQRGAGGRDAAAERLQHRRLRQVARDRRLGGQPLRPDRPLADPLGLRQVLRLHRRRDQPVGAGHLRRHDQVEPPKDPETTTS